MYIEDVETEALKLDPKARARLAERQLESLEDLSEEENVRLWAEEAERRDPEIVRILMLGVLGTKSSAMFGLN
jgi:hypothetical protein